MISHSGSRLAVAAVMLVLQSLIFIIELLIFTKRVRRTSWYRPVRQFVGPVLMASLVAILMPITFDIASSYVEGGAEHCSSSVDGDVAGQGSQIAVWAQVGVLLIISVLGSFHTSATGAKEVGVGLVLTHVSLTIALLTQMRLGTLSSADAIVGSMILDAQNAGLSIQLTAKETLAARWQVRIVVLSQLFGLISIPVIVWNFVRGQFASDDCRCLTVFWWAWLSSCGSATARETPVFWTYYSCRCVGSFQVCFHSLYNTSKFDKAEKSERPVSASWKEGPDMVALDEEQQLGAGLLGEREEQGDDGNHVHHDQGRNHIQEMRDTRCKPTEGWGIRLRRVTHLYRRQNGQVVCFREYPVTVTLMYTVYGAFSLISMGTVQTSVANFNLKPPSPIDSVGQITSLVVAAATIGRAAWLFFMLFRHEARSGDSNFVWPFKWHVNHDHLRGLPLKDYVFCSTPNKEPNIFSLGTLLTEPFDLNSHIKTVPHAPEELESSEELDVSSRGSSAWILESIHIGCRCGSVSFHLKPSPHSDGFKADRLSTSWFDPSSRLSALYVTERLQDPLLATMREQALYMVTGIKIAKGLTILRGGSNRSKRALYRSQSEVLLAYRLHIVRWSRHKRTFILDSLNRPEEDW